MIRSAFISSKGGRDYNEDSVCERIVSTDIHCIVLADGLGGHGGGDIASAEVCRTVCENWNGDISAETANDLLLKSHEAVHLLQREDCRMKSTGVILLSSTEKIAWGHVGDSRLYWFTNGKLFFQTKDHSASQAAVLMGKISQEEIRFHEDRSRLMKALGQEGNVTAETDEAHLLLGQHRFLLCSDGFWEYVLENEMEETLSGASEPEEWLSQMETILLKRVKGDNDNYTAAALWL